MSWLSDRWHDLWDPLSDALASFDDYAFNGGFEDDLRRLGRKFDEYIIEPIYDWQKGFVNGMLDDPLKAIFQIILMATGAGWVIPLMNTADTVFKKAVGWPGYEDVSWGDIAKGAAKTYATGKLIGGFSQKYQGYADLVPESNFFLQDVLLDGLVDGFSASSTALVLGDSFSDAFLNPFLEASVPQLVGMAMGKVDELADGLNFETIEGEFKKLPTIIQDTIAGGINAKLQGQDVTEGIFYEAVTNAIITSKTVSGVLETLDPDGVNFLTANNELSNQMLSFLTGGVQNAVTSALSGGTGEEAAAHLLGALEANGAAALSDFFDESALGKMVEKGVDWVVDAVDNGIRFAGDTFAVGVKMIQGSWQAHKDAIDALEAMATPEFLNALEEANGKQDEILELHENANESIAGQQDLMRGILELQEGGEFLMFATNAERDDYTMPWVNNPRVYRKSYYTQEEYDAYVQANGTAPAATVGQEVYRQVVTTRRDDSGMELSDEDYAQWETDNAEWIAEKTAFIIDSSQGYVYSDYFMTYLIHSSARQDPNVEGIHEIDGLSDDVLVNPPSGTVAGRGDNYWNAGLDGKTSINYINTQRNDPFSMGGYYNPYGPGSQTGGFHEGITAEFGVLKEYADEVGINAVAAIDDFDNATAGYDTWAEDWSARTGFDATDITTYNELWNDVVTTQGTLGLESDNFWNNFDDDIENINVTIAVSMDENFDSDWYFENYNMAETGGSFTRSEAAQHYLAVGSKQNYFTNQDAYVSAIQTGAITALSNQNTLGGQIPAVYNPKAIPKVSDAAYNNQSFDLAVIVNGLGLGNAGFVTDQGSIGATNAGSAAVQVNLNVNNADVAEDILRSLNAGGFSGVSASTEDISYLMSGNGALNYGLRDIDGSLENLERTKDTLQALNGSQKYNADGSITTWNFSPDIASIDTLLDTYTSFNNDSAKDWNNADTVLGDGVTWEDVVDGNTTQTFDVATGTYVLESSIPTSTMWDSTTGSKDVAGNSLENQRYTDPNAYLSNVNSLFSGDFGATMEEIVVYADSNNVTYIPSEVRELAAARAEALQNAKDDDSLSEQERREALFGLNNEYATVLNASAAVVKQYAGLKGYWERLTTSEGGAVDPELMARAEALETMATSYTTAELKAAREDMDRYIQNFDEFLKDPDTGEFLRDDLGNKIRRDYYVNEEGLEGKELLSAQANNSMLMVLGSYKAAPTSFMYDMLLQEILESAPAIAAGTASGLALGAAWGRILGPTGTVVGSAVGAAGGFVYSTGARAYNIANNLMAKKAALGIGAGVDVAFAMGAAYEGQSDLVRQLVTEQYKAIEELSFITDPPSMVRKYSDEQIAEIADRQAATAGLESATRQGITLSLLMGMGKLAAEEALLGTNTGQNKVFNSMWDAASDRVIDTTKIALKEGATGGADEGLLALGDNIWINKNVDKDWGLSESAFDAMWAGIFIEGTIGAGTSLVGAGSGVYINTNSEVNKDSNGLNNDLSGTGASTVLMFNPLVSNAMEQIKNKQKLLEWDDETALNAATGFLGSIGVEYDNPAYSDFLNEIDDAAYNSSTEVADQFKILGYTPTQAELANFTGLKTDLNMPLTTAVTQYAAPYVILASDVTAAAQAAGLQYATQADIRALSGAFAAGITKEDAIAGITTQIQEDKFTGEEFKAYLVSDHGFTEGQAEAYYNANKADIDNKLTLGTSSVIQEGFGNIFTDTGQFLEDNPVAPPPPELTAEDLAIQQLDEELSNKNTDAYRYFLKRIKDSHAPDGSLYINRTLSGGYLSLEDLLRSASNYELTRAEVEESFVQQFGNLGVSREDSDFDAQVDAYMSEQGITLGTNSTAFSPQPTLFPYISNNDVLKNAAQNKWVATLQNILDDAGVTDFELTESNVNAFKNRTNPIEEFTAYAEQQKRNRDARIEASTTLSNGTAQAVLITRFGMSNMTWDAEQGKNVPNQEMADIIAKHFALGEGAEGSALERLNAGIDAYRTELIEDKYGITPTPEQLERLRDATTTQWMNDPEILQARRDLAAANNAKTLNPMELAYYLAELGVSYNADDGIYRTILGMGFTGEGEATFDADQRAAIAAEVTRLKEAYDAENDAAQQLADTKQAFIDAGYTPTDLEVEQFLTDNAGIPDFITNTVKPRVKQAFIDAGYNPDAATVDAYLNNTAGIAGFVQGKRNDTAALFGDYNPSEQDITDYLNNNAGIAGFVQDKRNDTAALFGDYNPTPQEVTDYLNNNAGIAGYLAPRQYTRDEAIADLETELGRSLTQEEIDDGVYDSFLAGVVQLDGDTSADATGKTQVESDITSADDVKSYLEGLDYDTTGLSNEDLLAFAGTGLGIDLGTATSEYQTANETITQRDARLAAEADIAAELAAKTAAINAAMDDASQDGGAYSGVAYDGIRDYYLYNVKGKPQYDALDEEGRKALVQRAVDDRRYSESEIAADIRTAFPADADLSVEDLKTKYGTLFTNLQTEGNYGHEDNQRIAFDEGTITGDEANDYFRDVLGYEGWIPTGNIDSRLVGVGDESTVLPTDPANLTGKTLDLYNETTITQDEVMAAMITNPTDFGFADAAAVGQAISEGLDLSAYTGRYWQTGGTGTAETSKSLVDRLDDATVSQDEIDAYLTGQGYDPATAGTFDSSLGFGTTSVEDITSGYRGGVDADRAEEAEIQRQTDAINAALDDATQDGGAYTPGDRQGFIDWFVNNKNFEGKTAEEIKATIYDDIDNKRYTRSEVADDLRAAFPADAGLSVEELEAKYAGAFDLVKTGAYATENEQRTAFGAATTTEAEARASLEATGFVIPEGFDFTNFTGVMDETQLGTQISTDLAPLQYTRADAEAALAAELGRTLTAEDLTTYKDYLDGLVDMTGARTNAQGDLQVQGDITSEQEVRDYLSDYTLGEDFSFDGLTGLGVDLDTELGDFKADNRTTAQNQIAADLGTKGWADASDADIAAVESLDSAGRDAWVAERQFTRDQAITALSAQGIDANHPQFESLITQLVVDKGAAGTPTTQGELVDDPEDTLIDKYIITQDEIDTATGGYSYFDFTQTPLGIEPGVADDTTLAGLVQTHVGDNYVQADAAREALNGIAGVDAYEQDGDGAYVITDDQLVGMGLAGQYDPTTLGSKVDAATTTEEEVRAAFGENYDPTDAEIARYMGLLPDGDIGTTIPAYVAGRMDTLVSDVGDLALTVGQLQDQLNGALAEGGSLDQAVSKVADDLGIAEDALLKLIGDNSTKFDDLETAFGTQATDDQEATGIWANIAGLEGDVSDLQDAFGTQGVVDDPNTLDIDESSPATGVYGIIDQIANGSLDNEDAIAALEAVIGEPATYAEDGTTVLTPATGVYAQSGEGVNDDVLQAINAVYDYVGNMDTVGSAELEAIGAVVGKPAQEVTQEDIDAVTSLVQGTTVDPETGVVSLYDAKYDVNNDGIVDTRDQDLLTAVQEGDYSVYGGELATDSLFSNTGFYDIFDETRYDTEIQRKQDQDIQNEINEEINNNININTNIFLDAQKKAEEEADKQEYARLMQQVQAMSQVSVETPQELANIEYMYDVYGDSPFANDQQRGLYQSPYARAKQDEMATQQLPLRAAAEGGLIEDETDELMKLLGI